MNSRSGWAATTGGRRCEQGSGTVLALGAVACLLLVLAGGLAVAGAVAASHRARAAADLSALAAASAWSLGSAASEACGEAAALAQANGAELVDCSTGVDGSVTTRVSAPVPWMPPPLGYRSAQAAARAGPAP